jgi:16S rRNA (cytosine967-C5)-methyltransferase
MLTLDVSDASATADLLQGRSFNGIICDVPCTGSGTWSRTPESSYFFNADSVAVYSKRQEAILTTAADYIGKGGRIIYITCSVFRAENEDVIEKVAASKGLQIVSSVLINGAPIGADALFAAELRGD